MIKTIDGRYGPMMFPDNDVWMGVAFELYGEAMFHEIDFLLRCVKEGDVFVDAGAHIGTITMPLANKIGEGGYVVAFEPQQFLNYVLCGNVALNNLHNTQVFNRALGEEVNKKLFMKPLDYDAKQNFGSLALTEHQVTPQDGVANTVTIDNLGLNKLNLIKIDVEGMGIQVLKGGVSTIQSYKPYIFIEAMPGDPVEIVKWLEGEGYVWNMYETPYYNKNNIRGNTIDSLRSPTDPALRLISSDIFAHHEDREKEAAEIMEEAEKFWVDVTITGYERHKTLKEHVEG